MSEAAAAYGRVEADGTVYVRTPDGERSVGQVPDVSPEEALQFFVRRFEALETEVKLLATRIGNAAMNPEAARKAVASARKSVEDANAVGDLAGLLAQLDELEPAIEAANEERKAQRAKAAEEAIAAKQALVEQAEKIAAGNDWRHGMNRFSELLEQWKALPHFDRNTDNELWSKFSAARTTFTRNRRAHYAEDNAKREAAKAKKEQIIERARELSTSTDWGPTSGEFRDLMSQWKAAGQAPRDVDEKLWQEFRGLQDVFFNARTAQQDEQNAEFSANLAAKEQLLDDAEQTLLPVTDAKAGREAYRDFLTKYNEHGKVPRDAIRRLDARLRALEDAVKTAEEAEWRRSDPEAKRRAEDTVNMFSEKIAKYETELAEAQAKGDAKKVAKLTESIEAYKTWRDTAQQNLNEFNA